MNTKIFPLIINKKVKEKFSVEINRYGFERLAGSLGLFNADFLKSLKRADVDVKNKRIKKLRTLRDLR